MIYQGVDMKFSIKQRIILIAVLSAVVPVVVSLLITYYQKENTATTIIDKMDVIKKKNVDQVAEDVYAMCKTIHELSITNVKSNLTVANYVMKQYGDLLHTAEIVKWTAINQDTKESKEVQLSGITLGATAIGKNYEVKLETPFIDRVAKLTGGTCTIFQRISEDGDMLRVATNVVKEGKRAIGTYIPFKNADGTPNKVIAAVLKGETYYGMAKVVDDYYITAYQPMKDKAGKVTGMLYVGLKMESLNALRENILKIKVGETGYVYVLGGKSKNKGKYIISKDGKSDGKDLWESKDANGKFFIQDIVNAAVEMKETDAKLFTYSWKNPEEKEPRNKIAYIKYFEPWDWVIGSSTYEDDYFKKADINDTVNNLIYYSILGSVVILAILIIVAVLFSNRLANRIRKLTEISRKFRKGDLSMLANIKSSDELGELGEAFDGVINTVRELIEETNILTQAAAEGKLDIRGNTGKFEGGYKDIIEGINRTLDNVIGPLNIAAEYVDRIGKGDIPSKITEVYKGSYNDLKNNLNNCIDSVNMLISDTMMLVEASAKGNRNLRADASKHSKDYRSIIEGFNNTLDGITNPFNVLIADINSISKACADGKLDYRGDLSKHEGEFKDVLRGINDILDNLIRPLNVAAEYVDRISKGDMPPEITENYKGDFNEIKTNLNTCIQAIRAMVHDAVSLSKTAMEGKLSLRADASKHQGDFNKIITGINKTLDSVVGFFEAIPTPIQFMDNEYNLLFINKTGADLLGKSKEELLKQKCKDVWKTKKCSTDQCPCHVAMVKDDGYTCDNECAVGGKDLNIFCAGAPIHDESGKVIGSFEFVMDQTEIMTMKGDMEKKAVEMEEKVFWFEQLLDSISFPISVTDMNMNWTFINKAAETVTGRKRHEVIGTQCSNWGADICGKDGCGITCLRKGNPVSFFTQPGMDLDFRVDTSYILNKNGARIGHIEVVQDVSKVSRVAKYNEIEVNRLAANLNSLAAGNIDFDSNLTPPTDLTKEEYENFRKIMDSLMQAGKSIGKLIDDAEAMSVAAVEGKLKERIDLAAHKGEYRKVAEGINKTLDAVINPVNDSAALMALMAQGDMTVRNLNEYRGDHQKLKESINTVGESLSTALKQINEAVDSVANSAFEMSSTADTLASSSQEQAAQSDEVASAVEEMSRTVTENAISAGKTSEMASVNGKVAEEGGEVVLQTVNKMKDIAEVVRKSAENIQKLGESSKQIGEIISVIDDIADQTNLLALNAAIEAARAGEQGRGFAVVADEVRKLAERTTDATKQIASMIKGIQNETQQAVEAMNKGNEEVKSGITLADRAGQSLKQIVESSRDLLDMINQIAAASEQQSSTSEEIAKNVAAISEVSSHSSRRVQEIAHSAEDMTSLTESLKNMMSQFKIEQGGSGAGASRSLGSPKRREISA